MNNPIRLLSIATLGALATSVLAAPTTYEVDAKHTHPLFVADHFGGVSKWRGVFNASGGKIVLDREANSGTVEVSIDTASVLTGVPEISERHLQGQARQVQGRCAHRGAG
jgi:polyisoprenoid-binding protein YceI